MKSTVIIIAALFLAFLVSANGAVTVRTTVITTSDDAIGLGRETKEQCRDERQTAMGMRECMMYVSEGSPYGGIALRMVVEKENPGAEQMLLQQCCEKLANVPEHCRCGVVDKMMKMTMQQQEGQHQQQKQKKKMMMQQFKNLPKMCKLEPQVC